MIKPIGVRKVAVVGNGEEETIFDNLLVAWKAFKAAVPHVSLPDKFPGNGQAVIVRLPDGAVSYHEREEEYDLREPLVKLSSGRESKTLSLRDGRQVFSAACNAHGIKVQYHSEKAKKIEIHGLLYEEVPAPVVKVGVCFVDDIYIGCKELKEARASTNLSLISEGAWPIYFEQLPDPVNLKRPVDGGQSLLHYYETTTDQLEIPTIPKPQQTPGETQWTWSGQSGAEKYGKTRADFPTPFGFIRAERNPISGVESYELLKGKFIHVQPPQGDRYDVTVKEDGKVVEERKNLSRKEIADDYYPDYGDESLLMEFRETETTFEAKIRPDAPGAKAFRLYAQLVK